MGKGLGFFELVFEVFSAELLLYYYEIILTRALCRGERGSMHVLMTSSLGW